jgi:hypothetical protein
MKYKKSNRKCGTCDVQLFEYQSKFCSKKCDSADRRKTTKIKIENKEKTSVDSLRRYLRETRDGECEICKGREWFGHPMPLVMDHINGDPSDDSPENLRLICPNCDRFLPTFGSRNKGNGRKSKGIKRGSDL